MSWRSVLALLLLLLVCPGIVAAQSADQLFVRPTGEVLVPLNTYQDSLTGETKPLYSTGFSAGGILDFQVWPWLVPYAAGKWGWVPFAGGATLQFSEGDLGVGLVAALSDRFLLRLDSQAGVAQLTLPSLSGIAYSAGFRLGLDYRIAPAFDLSVGGGYTSLFGSRSSILSAATGALSFRYHLSALAGEKAKVGVEHANLTPVFPSLYAYYDDNPFGTVSVRNGEDATITNVKVLFNAGHYMDQPKVCGEYAELQAGAAVTVPVRALFTDAVLGITQGVEVKGEVIVRYTYLGSQREVREPVDFRMHHRNAISWSDDRRAAAFVSPTNPAALWFARFATGVVNDRLRADLNRPLQYAMGLFEAERLYGLNYVVVPSNDYSVKHEIKDYIDSVQFPHQTIINRGGDCSDLAILFSSLMESVGIESAFITAPGHIFAAFDTGLDEAAASEVFSDPGLLIFRDGKVWVPVEITMVKDGFLKAWRVGAKEWIDNSKAGTAAFYRVRDCWKTYPSAAFPDVNPRFVLPETPAMVQAVDTTLDRYVQREIVPQVASLEARMAGVEPRVRANELGVLYASYGLFAQARVPLQEAAHEGLRSAWDNLGNVAFIQQDYPMALSCFRQALAQDPTDDVALLGMARCQFEQEDFTASDAAYKKLQSRNPELASRFGYLGSVFGGEGRAFSLSERLVSTSWVRTPPSAAPAVVQVTPAPAEVAVAPAAAVPAAAPEPAPAPVAEAPAAPVAAEQAPAEVAVAPAAAPAAPEPAPAPVAEAPAAPVAAEQAPAEVAAAPAAAAPAPAPVAEAPAAPVAAEQAPAEVAAAPAAAAPAAAPEPAPAPVAEAPAVLLPDLVRLGFDGARPALGAWQVKPDAAGQKDADQFFAKLVLPVTQSAKTLRYSFSARSAGSGWVGVGLHLLVDEKAHHRGYGEGSSWLVWLTRDPVHYAQNPVRIQLYHSLSDVRMELVAEAPVSAAIRDWNQVEVSADLDSHTFSVRLNGEDVLQFTNAKDLGAGQFVVLRALDRAEFKDLRIEAER